MKSETLQDQKKVYTSPQLKEWGSIADITLGHGTKTYDTDLYQTWSSVQVD